MNSAIDQKADSIITTVSEKYVIKDSNNYNVVLSITN